MKLDKYDRMFIAFMLVVVTLFNIGKCFAVDETVDVSVISGLNINTSYNYFTSGSSTNYISYFEVESNYIYHIYNNGNNPIDVVTSEVTPSLNVPYEIITSIDSKSSYNYIGKGNLYISSRGNNTGTNIIVTREKIEGMNDAIGGLVDNVGVNQLWNVFESGVDFIGVVVLVAFGLFLIFLLIKKINKGKSDF